MNKLAEFLVYSWLFATLTLFLCGWLNYLLIPVAIGHRIVQARDPHFDLRPTTPTHAALFGLCALFYGLLVPVWYFVTVRLNDSFEIWRFGPHANNRLTIFVGIACTLWLLGKCFGAVREGRALRFGGRTDRLFAAAGFLLFAWLEFWFVVNAHESFTAMRSTLGGAPKFFAWLIGVAYPLPFFIGSMFVYASAWTEARRNAAEQVSRLRDRLRCTAMAAALVLILGPYLISLPRAGHDRAMRLIEMHRADIVDVAGRADLDPRLLAGIIYVNQTHGRSRYLGNFIEDLGFETLRTPKTTVPLYDGGIALCGVRPSAVGAMYYATSIAAIRPATGPAVPPPPGAATGGKVPLPPPPRKALDQWLDERPIIRDLDLVIANPNPQHYYLRMAKEEHLRGALNNITLAAAILQIFRNEWRGYHIDDRPEILATLYDLGFGIEKPNSNLKPNDFGRRVKAFMDSPECARLFPPAPKREGKP